MLHWIWLDALNTGDISRLFLRTSVTRIFRPNSKICQMFGHFYSLQWPLYQIFTTLNCSPINISLPSRQKPGRVYSLSLIDTKVPVPITIGTFCAPHPEMCVIISGGNLFKNRPRASTSEYKQPPINLRLFQNTVKCLDNCFLSKKAEIRKWKKIHPDAR